MSKVIDFPGTKKEEFVPVNAELQERKKEALKKLPQYRGEVVSKNSIRQLPEVKEGQIFWVEMDHKPYVVAEINGKKMTIKALDDTATITTGLTIYDMNRGIVAKEPVFDFAKDGEATAERLAQWFNEDCPPNTYYMMYGRNIHYVTLIKTPGGLATKDVFNKVAALIKPIGDLISMDFNTDEGSIAVEIWVRTAESPAELIYLMPYDAGLVEF